MALDLNSIAIKMIKSKFTPMQEGNPFIGISELPTYGLSIKKILDETDMDYEEDSMYNVFRAYFNPKERVNKKAEVERKLGHVRGVSM